jgi:hypothetical protein
LEDSLTKGKNLKGKFPRLSQEDWVSLDGEWKDYLQEIGKSHLARQAELRPGEFNKERSQS